MFKQKFKGTLTKWPVQKLTHRTRQKHLKHNDEHTFRKAIFLCFSDFYFLFSFLLIIHYMNSPRDVELPPCYGQ